jgi:hypothetical protein
VQLADPRVPAVAACCLSVTRICRYYLQLIILSSSWSASPSAAGACHAGAMRGHMRAAQFGSRGRGASRDGCIHEVSPLVLGTSHMKGEMVAPSCRVQRTCLRYQAAPLETAGGVQKGAQAHAVADRHVAMPSGSTVLDSRCLVLPFFRCRSVRSQSCVQSRQRIIALIMHTVLRSAAGTPRRPPAAAPLPDCAAPGPLQSMRGTPAGLRRASSTHVCAASPPTRRMHACCASRSGTQGGFRAGSLTPYPLAIFTSGVLVDNDAYRLYATMLASRGYTAVLCEEGGVRIREHRRRGLHAPHLSARRAMLCFFLFCHVLQLLPIGLLRQRRRAVHGCKVQRADVAAPAAVRRMYTT